MKAFTAAWNEHDIFSLYKYLDKQKQLSRACYLKSVTNRAESKKIETTNNSRRLHGTQPEEKERIPRMHVHN